MLAYRSGNPGASKSDAASVLPLLSKWNNKACMAAHLFTTWFTEYFKPVLETCCSGKKKKISFRILLLIDKAPGDSRALMEMYKEINVVFMPASTSSFCSPWIRRNFEFQVYHWRNTFCKTLTSRDSGSSDESGQNKIKIF